MQLCMPRQIDTLISDRDDHVEAFFVMAGDEPAVRTIDGNAMLLHVCAMDEETLTSKVCLEAVKGRRNKRRPTEQKRGSGAPFPMPAGQFTASFSA